MSEDLTLFWRKIINDFDPIGPLSPSGPSAVDRYYVDRGAGSPSRSVIQRLPPQLRNSLAGPRPYKGLLTGHSGTGKSSELLRIGQALGDAYFVVLFDAENSLAYDKANQFDVLLGMGLAVHGAAQAAKLKPDQGLIEKLADSLTAFVRTHDEKKGFTLDVGQLLGQVAAFAIGATVDPAAGLVVQVANTAFNTGRLELNIGDDLVRTLELPANKVEVMGTLNKIIAHAEEIAKKPVLIITDGLDKVLAARAQVLFSDSRLLVEPECALLYAAPIEFYYRVQAGQANRHFDQYSVLPNAVVRRPPAPGSTNLTERQRDLRGIAILQAIVGRRLANHGKTVADVIAPTALEALAEMSGGVIREFIRSFRDAATLAQFYGNDQIDDAIARDVLGQQRQEVGPRLTVEHREALQAVLDNGALNGGRSSEIEEQLLHNLYLLSYQDNLDRHWFDAHPNVLPLLFR